MHEHEPIPGQTTLWPPEAPWRPTMEPSELSELAWTVLALIAEHEKGLTDLGIARIIGDLYRYDKRIRARADLQRARCIEWRLETGPGGGMVWHATNYGRELLAALDDPDE